jgi:hypothetical protein
MYSVFNLKLYLRFKGKGQVVLAAGGIFQNQMTIFEH